MCYDDASVDRHASLSGENDCELPNDIEQLKAIILQQQNEIKALKRLKQVAEEIIAIYREREELWKKMLEDDKK